MTIGSPLVPSPWSFTTWISLSLSSAALWAKLSQWLAFTWSSLSKSSPSSKSKMISISGWTEAPLLAQPAPFSPSTVTGWMSKAHPASPSTYYPFNLHWLTGTARFKVIWHVWSGNKKHMYYFILFLRFISPDKQCCKFTKNNEVRFVKNEKF